MLVKVQARTGHARNGARRTAAGCEGEDGVSQVPFRHDWRNVGQGCFEPAHDGAADFVRPWRWRGGAHHGMGGNMTMPKDKRPATGAGAIIAFAIMAGAVIGGLKGQPSAGLLAGAAVGAAIAIWLWWRDTRR